MTIENPTVANVLGTIGTVCWCIQLIPQIIHNYRRKNCEGLNPVMLFLWSASGIPFSIFFVSRRSSIPIQIQPQLFTFFCVCTWVQSLYYPPVQLPKKKILVLISAFLVFSIALEASVIPFVRTQYDQGVEWPSLIFGILASILLAIGLVPPYFELAKRQGRVVGINFLFLTLDTSGAVFSILSLIFEEDLDILGLVLYTIVACMELGIFVSHFIWWLRIGRKELKQPVDEENSLEPTSSIESGASIESTTSSITLEEEKIKQDANEETCDLDIAETRA